MDRFIYIFITIIYMTIPACSYQDDSGHAVTLKRFDRELLKAMSDDTGILPNNYIPILKIYATGIIKCSLPGDSTDKMVSDLKSVYASAKGFGQLYGDTENIFYDTSDIEKELSCGAKRYLSLFPGSYFPEIYTHVSGFSQSIITADSIMSIALDNYLGKEYKGYKGVFFDYQLKNRERSRIVPDIFTVCLYEAFPYNVKKRQVIDGMIYEGCIIYAISRILPNRSISEIMNYSDELMEWCEENERNIWAYMVKSEHLYSSDPLIYSKYMNDAPYTSFFGKGSPDRLGIWLGYKIIESYIKSSNSDSILTELLSGKYETAEILTNSKYGN